MVIERKCCPMNILYWNNFWLEFAIYGPRNFVLVRPAVQYQRNISCFGSVDFESHALASCVRSIEFYETPTTLQVCYIYMFRTHPFLSEGIYSNFSLKHRDVRISPLVSSNGGVRRSLGLHVYLSFPKNPIFIHVY